MSLRVLIADDEWLSRARLRRLLGSEPDVAEIEESDSGATTMAALERQTFDVLLLDIELPESTGFEVVERLTGKLPVTIFVTAYGEYAVRAFDVSATDYLLKPVDGKRLRIAMDRARERLAQQAAKPTWIERIPVRDSGRIRFVAVSEIDYIEAQGNYVAIHAGRREELLRDTLSAMQQRLDPSLFVRVHRRFLVRRDRICELEARPNGEFTWF